SSRWAGVSSLSLDIVAEGVETPAQRDELLALGCDLGQGYLFARPLTFEDLAAAVGGRAHPVASGLHRVAATG
ncbi:MAG TPA: EAL domain-containing protein, partial [Gaiellaceae bacterium]|nr:EAL domain-containing protein [Gaiellaceae bacterium]